MYSSKHVLDTTIEEDMLNYQRRSWKSRLPQNLWMKRLWRVTLLVVGLLFFAKYFLPVHPYSSSRSEAESPSRHSSGTSKQVSNTDNRAIPQNVDWSQYAYSQYVTAAEHICQAVMMFESLARLQSKAERIMIYPDDWDIETGADDDFAYLMRKARDEYDVKLVPVQLWSFGEGTWSEGFTKFLVFNQTQYKRVLALDSDATLLQNLDELFFLPSSRIALCHGYWYPKLSFSGQLMLVEPSTAELARIYESLEAERLEEDWDTEVLNRLYWHEALYIPSRPYDLLSQDFRNLFEDHYGYMGNHDEDWDGDKILAEAKYIHFSDWPFAKPWIQPTLKEIDESQPRCFEVEGLNKLDCRDRENWWWLYNDFADRRERVCGAKYLWWVD